jgi:hypothetical protein
MPLPPHLLSKLLAEFTSVSNDSISIRIALTIAAFYAGIVGPRIEWPWDVIAKTQWIFKAIELGSHAALSPLSTDQGILEVLETFGPRIFEIRRPVFQTPEVDWDKLISRLREFEEMGDGEVSKILSLIAPEEASLASQDTPARVIEEAEDPEVVEHKRVVRAFLRKFTLTRGADLGVLDSDAYDLDYGVKGDIVQSVYSNSLEDFISFAERDRLEPGSERLRYYMSVAIMNGSLEVVRYIVEHYGASPNDGWGGPAEHYTHFEDAVMFGRRAIVQFFLDHDANISPATGGKLSALHLAPRHDDDLLIRMFCEYLKTNGNLQEVLESKPDEGEYPSCSPIGLAMNTGAWKAVKVLLDYGANINAEPAGNGLLDSAVRPRSPACPTDVLQAILEKGAKINVIPEKGHPPLQWAIWTSNIVAVLHLLLHGASLYLSDEYDFLHEAKEVFEARRDGKPLEVVDEDEKPLTDSWQYAQEAGGLILEMVRVTSASEADWKARIQDLVNTRAQKCKGKMWIVIGKEPLMSVIEVKVPATA